MGKQRRHAGAVLFMSLGLCVAGLGTTTVTASASTTANNSGRVHYYVPRQAKRPTGGGTRDLFFHNVGASVEVNPKIYLSFWGPEWTALTDAQNAQTYVHDFFSDLGGSSWLGTTSQYCDKVPAGTVDCPPMSATITNPTDQLGGVFNDLTPVPSHPSNSDIVAAADRLVSHFGSLDSNALYMVFTPSGKSQRGFGSSFCAYHGAASVPQGTMAFAYVPYQPDSPGCNANPGVDPTEAAFGGFSISAGHEYAEAQTDPFLNAWFDKNGEEIADKCENLAPGTIQLGSPAKPYAVQGLWSNRDGACVGLP
jgi:hypothetical protein